MLQKQAYSEVYYIISKLQEEEKNKIPQNLIYAIKNNMDINYNVNVEGKKLEDLQLLEDTKKILSVLYTDYLATNEEREIIKAKEQIIKEQNLEKKKSSITVKELFIEKSNNNEKSETSLIKVTDDKWYTKVYKFFLKIFKKN